VYIAAWISRELRVTPSYTTTHLPIAIAAPSIASPNPYTAATVTTCR
jgi:hypothetical protein